MDQLLTVQVNNPEKIIWEGEAESVSSENSAGPFDILPQHANFITVVENKPIKIRTSTGVVEYTFKNTIIYAHNNQVNVYTDI